MESVNDDVDITKDFLLCNRCGTCRSVCPLFPVFREEWASARGKVELAEAFFRGEKLDPARIGRIFDLCMHCMACEENCPSGMRADEIIMAVRAELARRGLIPAVKKAAFRLLDGMDNAVFKIMRGVGLARRAPLHGLGGRSPLRFLFPLLGWKRDRFVPLPKNKPFLRAGRELFKAEDSTTAFRAPAAVRRGEGVPSSGFDAHSAARLVERFISARERNLSRGLRAYFFVGHAVNHFFPEEAEAIVRVLNLLGVDVLAPADQLCCGAPVYFAGDIEGARRAAARALERMAGRRFDIVVTSCSSGGAMLKEVFPRLFDMTSDGYFEIGWDRREEAFFRIPQAAKVPSRYSGTIEIYRKLVEGKVFDVNELLAEVLELKMKRSGPAGIFGGAGGPMDEALRREEEDTETAGRRRDLPVVTYHHPCHLKRRQGIGWQPETILDSLPGHRYVGMKEADRCCGGGGAFTFLHAPEAEAISQRKMDAIEAVRPDILATACPVCRIQLMDMMHCRFVLERKTRGLEPRYIPVKTPVEILLDNLSHVLRKSRRRRVES